jgi:hypothetical protein
LCLFGVHYLYCSLALSRRQIITMYSTVQYRWLCLPYICIKEQREMQNHGGCLWKLCTPDWSIHFFSCYVTRVCVFDERNRCRFRSVPLIDNSVSVSTVAELRAGRLGFDSDIFSLRHRIQTSTGAHPATSPVGIGGSFPGGKATGV